MTYARFRGATPRSRVLRRAPPRSARVHRPRHHRRSPSPAASAARSASCVTSTAAPASASIERQPLGGIRRVQRHVGAARLEHGQQRRPPSPARAPGRSPRAPPGPTPQRAQVVRQPVGPRVQLARSVSVASVADHRDRVRRARRLRLEQLVDARARADTSASVRFHASTHQPPLRLRQHVQRRRPPRPGARSSASTSRSSAVCISAHTRSAPPAAATCAVSRDASPRSSTDSATG